MEIAITPELVKAIIGSAVAALVRAIIRSIQSRGAAGRGSGRTNVAVSVDHGLAGVDVVVRVSSDLNKSSRDLCS